MTGLDQIGVDVGFTNSDSTNVTFVAVLFAAVSHDLLAKGQLAQMLPCPVAIGLA